MFCFFIWCRLNRCAICENALSNFLMACTLYCIHESTNNICARKTLHGSFYEQILMTHSQILTIGSWVGPGSLHLNQLPGWLWGRLSEHQALNLTILSSLSRQPEVLGEWLWVLSRRRGGGRAGWKGRKSLCTAGGWGAPAPGSALWRTECGLSGSACERVRHVRWSSEGVCARRAPFNVPVK